MRKKKSRASRGLFNQEVFFSRLLGQLPSRLGGDALYNDRFELILDFLIHNKTAKPKRRGYEQGFAERQGGDRSGGHADEPRPRARKRGSKGAGDSVRSRARQQHRINTKLKRTLYLYRHEVLSGATFLFRPRLGRYVSVALVAADYFGLWEGRG